MVWLQPIENSKFDQQSKHNQKIFEAITGERNLPIVSLVTTKWSNACGSRVLLGTYKKREAELEKRWAHLLDNNAQLLRDDNENLLDMILKHSKGESPLALQEELVTNKWSLAQTASGKILSEEFRTDHAEEEIVKMLDQILIDRNNGTPNNLLVSDAQRAYDSYVEKRKAKHLLDEWTFDEMVGSWVGIPTATAGISTVGVVGSVALLQEGLTVALAVGGTTVVGVAAVLATAGIAVAVVGGALLYQHITRKPLPVGDKYCVRGPASTDFQLLIRITGNRLRFKSPGHFRSTITHPGRGISRDRPWTVGYFRQDRRWPPQRPFDKTCAICEASR